MLFELSGLEGKRIEIGNSLAIQWFSSVQLLSRVQLCDPMDCSTPGLPVHHQLVELYPNSCPLSW